jgi:large subunit ribosomal protein L14
MICQETVLECADNTGAKELLVIRVHDSNNQSGGIGTVVTCAVNSADPRGMVRKSDVVDAVIICVDKEYQRDDGSTIRFDRNAAVILEGKSQKGKPVYNPKGTRVFSPVARELRDKNFMKIISLAPEVL